MKSSGSGRIIFWRGGSLWIGRSGEPARFHSHHAVQISVSLSSGALQFKTPEQDWKPYEAAIIPAHQEHAFEGCGNYVAMIFVEPESIEGRSLSTKYARHEITALDALALRTHKQTLMACYQATASNTQFEAAACALVAKLAAISNPMQITADKRVNRARQLIRERIGGSISLADIAGEVFLSPERFRHLFVTETGIRFRPYVLWLRIETALAVYAAKGNLTEASHVGGFADSAHFSRTFMRMFGIAPSSIQLD